MVGTGTGGRFLEITITMDEPVDHTLERAGGTLDWVVQRQRTVQGTPLATRGAPPHLAPAVGTLLPLPLGDVTQR